MQPIVLSSEDRGKLCTMPRSEQQRWFQQMMSRQQQSYQQRQTSRPTTASQGRQVSCSYSQTTCVARTQIAQRQANYNQQLGRQQQQPQHPQKQPCVIDIKDFIDNVIKDLSHPMNGDKYESIINKYNDKDNKYSFILMVFNGTPKFYGDKDECDVHHGSLEISIVIIDNIYELMHDNDDERKMEIETDNNDNDDTFPIIIRFISKDNKRVNYQNHVISPFPIGYPFKTYATKNMNAMDIYNKFIGDKKKYEIDSCSLNHIKINVDDIIFGLKSEKTMNQLVIDLTK